MKVNPKLFNTGVMFHKLNTLVSNRVFYGNVALRPDKMGVRLDIVLTQPG